MASLSLSRSIINGAVESFSLFPVSLARPGHCRTDARRTWRRDRPLFQVSHTTFFEAQRPNRQSVESHSFPAFFPGPCDEVGDVANDDEQPSHSVSSPPVPPRPSLFSAGGRRMCPLLSSSAAAALCSPFPCRMKTNGRFDHGLENGEGRAADTQSAT